jgi:hypothetical protein
VKLIREGDNEIVLEVGVALVPEVEFMYIRVSLVLSLEIVRNLRKMHTHFMSEALFVEEVKVKRNNTKVLFVLNGSMLCLYCLR